MAGWLKKIFFLKILFLFRITVSSSNQRITDTLIGGLNLIRNRSSAGNNSSLARHYGVSVNKKIHQNINRLTHYVEEPNLGRGEL